LFVAAVAAERIDAMRLLLIVIVLLANVAGCTTVVKDDASLPQRITSLEQRVSALEARR